LSTIPEKRLAVLVAVSPSAELLAACREAAHYVGFIDVQVTDVKSVATDAAKWRPFVIVIDDELFAFDPSEFIALAKDVAAEIVTVPGSLRRDELVTMLLPRLKAAIRRWEASDDAY
jgi:hypothetical protein